MVVIVLEDREQFENVVQADPHALDRQILLLVFVYDLFYAEAALVDHQRGHVFLADDARQDLK